MFLLKQSQFTFIFMSKWAVEMMMMMMMMMMSCWCGVPIELLKQIDKMADDYLSKVRGMAGEQRKDQLNSIQKLFNQSKKFGDEKVQLALQTYEMVSCSVLMVWPTGTETKISDQNRNLSFYVQSCTVFVDFS